ncbi:cytochrome d ubiquinol oxidase subunit II [Nocardioides sp. W3-2-3]|uniref:hypothetical protein n=1 Tax=Nocardioides convexus TaxID=2712224 RepID=UPI00241825AC|nr:hypothetical protein [Nocardioides convexus]NGZ99723.1 cytochrome d ubiquinol oxidase subunit II [Nocardioides convexus]
MVRSLVTGLTGVLGIALMALCALEIARSSRRIGEQGAWWFALVAALSLALYPRWTGAIFTNSKDMPLAVAMLAVLWLTLRAARRWEEERDRLPWRSLVALGVVFGVAVSIRVIALLWVPVVGVLALVWLLLRDRSLAGLRRVAAGAGVIGLASYLTILAVWPYIFLNPVSGLPTAISSMSKYPWDDPILFRGQMIQAMEPAARLRPHLDLAGLAVALGAARAGRHRADRRGPRTTPGERRRHPAARRLGLPRARAGRAEPDPLQRAAPLPLRHPGDAARRVVRPGGGGARPGVPALGRRRRRRRGRRRPGPGARRRRPSLPLRVHVLQRRHRRLLHPAHRVRDGLLGGLHPRGGAVAERPLDRLHLAAEGERAESVGRGRTSWSSTSHGT